MSQSRDEMNEADLARFHEAHADDETLWRKPPRTIRSRRGKGPSVTFSIRLTGEELTRISEAAFARGTNPTDFIRAAALDAVDSPADKQQRHERAINEVRNKVEELQQAVGRLRAS